MRAAQTKETPMRPNEVDLAEKLTWLRRRVGAGGSERVARVLLVLMLAVLLAQTLTRAYRPSGNDFTSYLLSARALSTGDNPYETKSPFPYVYPLLLAVVLRPALWIPYGLAVALWWLMSVWALHVAVRALLEPAGLRLTSVAQAFLFFFMLAPIQGTLLNGQVNFQVLALLVFFYRALEKRAVLAAAGFLALGIAIKLVPLALLPFLAVRREVRALLLSALVAGLLSVGPYLSVGERLWEFYAHYGGTFLLHQAMLSEAAPKVSFSLQRMLAAAFPALSGSPWPSVLALLTAASALLIAEKAASRRGRTAQKDAWAFSLYLVAIPLVTPLSRVHHLVLLIPAACLLTLSTPRRRGWLAVIALFWLSFWLAGSLRSGPLFFFSITLLYVLVLTRLTEISRGN